MPQLIEIPPGDPGAGAHRHSGPVFGYVTDGSILFDLEGEEPYEIKAGEAFREPGGPVVDWQAASRMPGQG
ncbi:cupin domain-containing protein [Lentzea sp. NPDC055074]